MRRSQIITATVGSILIVGGVLVTTSLQPLFERNKNQDRSDTATSTLKNQMVVRHPLSGIQTETPSPFFAVSVLYDNFPSVRMRTGLEYADVVYEALVEGGITRLMAVFDSTKQVPQFGPIRSARPYFIDWASEYGGVLMHVGGSPQALTQLRSSRDLDDVNQIGADELYFTRDESQKAPHNVYSSYSSWLKLQERRSVTASSFAPWEFADADPETVSNDRQQMMIVFSPTNTIGWVYDIESNTYLRFLNNERQMLATGSQITAANVIVLEVASKTIDTIGRQQMDTIGSGQAIVYRNGIVIPSQWTKDSASSRTMIVDEQGRAVVFTPGVTWIEVVPDLKSVTFRKLSS